MCFRRRFRCKDIFWILGNSKPATSKSVDQIELQNLGTWLTRWSCVKTSLAIVTYKQVVQSISFNIFNYSCDSRSETWKNERSWRWALDWVTVRWTERSNPYHQVISLLRNSVEDTSSIQDTSRELKAENVAFVLASTPCSAQAGPHPHCICNSDFNHYHYIAVSDLSVLDRVMLVEAWPAFLFYRGYSPSPWLCCTAPSPDETESSDAPCQVGSCCMLHRC